MDYPLLTGLFAVVAPMIASAYAGFVSTSVYFANRRHGRRRWTLDLHKSYHSGSYSDARWQAKALLQKYAPASLERVDDLEARLRGGPEFFDSFAQIDGLLTIQQFWTGLGVALKYEWADKAALTELFSYEFGWWYGFVIGELTLRADGSRGGDIHDLACWIDQQNGSGRRGATNPFRVGFRQGKAQRSRLSG